MPANVEIKASVACMKKLKEVVSKLSKSTGELIIQEDTFFTVPNGRLKLRELKGESQLIQYNRSDQEGPKHSDYHISKVSHPKDLKETLRRALGIKGVVKKERVLHLVGQTRIHLDSVNGLGEFMELEVVLEEGQSVDQGQVIADDLMMKLGIKSEHLITGAYMDLILKIKKQNGNH